VPDTQSKISTSTEQFPLLKPGLVVAFLNPNEFYIGDGSDGIYIPALPYLSIVRECNGSQSTRSIALICGVTLEIANSFLQELKSHNYLEMRSLPPAPVGLDELTNHYRERLKPEYDLFTWRDSTSDGGVSEISSRKSFAITIFGENRLARALLATLQASGFSQSWITSPSGQPHQRITAKDICGITTRPLDIGRKQSEFHKSLVLGAQLSHIEDKPAPQIRLIISTSEVEADTVQNWMRDGIPHIHISQSAAHSVEVGPLILPGVRACLNCIQLHRRDHLPPFITRATLEARAGQGPKELTASSITLIAGVLTPYICEFAARGSTSLMGNSITVDLLEPLHRMRYHHWNVHPECGCSSIMTSPARNQVFT